MLAWLFWHLERIERIHAVARSLVSELGAEAYAEARRQEREAQNVGAARDWRRVASVVARRMSRRAPVDAAPGPTPLELESAGEPTWMLPEPTQPFLIQFVCGASDRSETNVTERPIQAADASAAIVAAASAAWPPQTIGLRILDREGREVFAREKAKRT